MKITLPALCLTLLTTPVGCSSSEPTPSAEPACEVAAVDSPEGVALPLASLLFRNAFDPNDPAVYDPSDGESLPGPVMVDTWGDRSSGAHGTLGVFPPGFSAPLHTHSHAYSGVVLRGRLTNPFGTELESFLDGDATNDHGQMVLEAGSYWHVPANAQHTTTCLGHEVCWFYFHAEFAFDFTPLVDQTGALLAGTVLTKPHVDSLQLPASALEFAGDPGSFVQFATARGSLEQGPHETFGLFEAGATSPSHVHSSAYHGVVISGEVANPFNGAATSPALDVGGYWHVPAGSAHVTACAAGAPCRFYFHSRTAFDFTPICQ